MEAKIVRTNLFSIYRASLFFEPIFVSLGSQENLRSIVKLGLTCLIDFMLEFMLFFLIEPILVPIALFASLSRQGLGPRNEGLWRQKIFQS